MHKTSGSFAGRAHWSLLLFVLALAAVLLWPVGGTSRAADQDTVAAASASIATPPVPPPAPTWHAQTLSQAIGYMVLFSLIGIVLAIIGYKLFDLCTPGDLNKEIIENRNVAAALVAGAVVLGVCIIIAAAMLG
jgi:uncharacterized membrane protein YjfL (UPF0719 family)